MNNRGLSILELLVVLAALVVVAGLVYNFLLNGFNVFNAGYARANSRTAATQSLELAVKDLRQAIAVTSLSESSITFTANLGAGLSVYRLYLYNATDPEPNPPYTQTTYDLRLAQGIVTYGQGAVLARNIVQPVNVPFTFNGNKISIDLTVKEAEESIRLRTAVTPRNL